MNKTITIAYNAINTQSEILAEQEIKETLEGLSNSLKTQVQDVRVTITNEEKKEEKKNVKSR